MISRSLTVAESPQGCNNTLNKLRNFIKDVKFQSLLQFYGSHHLAETYGH